MDLPKFRSRRLFSVRVAVNLSARGAISKLKSPNGSSAEFAAQARAPEAYSRYPIPGRPDYLMDHGRLAARGPQYEASDF